MTARSGFQYSFLGLTLAIFAAFFVWPIWMVIQGGFLDSNGNLTFEYVGEVFRNPVYREGFLNAFWIGVLSTLFSVLLALPLAYLSDRYDFFGKKLFGALILLPIMLPPFVGAIGVRQLLGQYGVLNSFLDGIGIMDPSQPIDWLAEGRFWGVVVLNALGLYPIMYLNIAASLANIDPSMEEAASNLGANGWKRFFRVTLPLIQPGLFAGSTIVFIWSFTELGVPLVFDYDRVIAVQVFKGIKEVGGNPFPYAMVAVMLFMSAMIYVFGKLVLGRANHHLSTIVTHVSPPRKPSSWVQGLIVSGFLSVTFVALLPHIALILLSFSSDWYQSVLPQQWTLDNYSLALGNSLTIPSIQNSLFFAGLATIANIAFGIGIAFLLVRSSIRGRGLLDVLVMMPLAVPGIVIAFGYLAMTQEGRFFHFLNPIENPTVLMIIAYAIRKLPFVVRACVAGLQQSSVTLEEAAQNLGSSPFKTAVRITLPLILASILAGGLLAFSQSMLEVSDSLMLAQKQQFYPITKAIYELLGFLGDGRYIASALGVWAMLFLGVTIFGANRILGKKLGSVFRI